MTTTQTSLVNSIADILDDTHPHATVNIGESGPCDFQICSLGTVTAIVECGDERLTTEDIMRITVPEQNTAISEPVDYKQGDNHHLFQR